MRKTKIICTLGPATEKTATLQEMMMAGADVFRMNMSHAEHAWVREIVPRARENWRAICNVRSPSSSTRKAPPFAPEDWRTRSN